MNIHELNDTVLDIYESVYSNTASRQRARYMIEQIKMAPRSVSE